MSTNRAGLVAILLGVVGLAASTASLNVPAAKGGAIGRARRAAAKIAFVRTDPGPPWAAHLFVMNPDGSDLRQLTDGPAQDRNESWSPSGTRILFERWTQAPSNDEYPSDIYVVAPDGTRLERLTDDGSSFGAAWSPDGHSIAYGSGNRLVVMNPDGSGKHVLASVAFDWAGGATWSPDGRRIAFTTGGGAIFVVAANGTGKRRLNRQQAGADPTWSPHGDLIAFASGSPGHRYSSIYVVQADRRGARVRLVTRHAHNESGFAWSPDGRRIIYARENHGGIYMVDANGTHDRRLTRDSPRADLSAGGFSWSPDRGTIAYASEATGAGDIYVMNANGSGRRQVTDGPDIDGSARWSPVPRSVDGLAR